MAKTSPTQRTLAFYRAAGFRCAVTEHWNSFVKRRQDLFGFIDVVAVKPSDELPGVLAIQATTGSNLSKRIAKILELEAAKDWLRCGNRIHVVGWRKLKKSNRWEPDVRTVVIGDFEP